MYNAEKGSVLRRTIILKTSWCNAAAQAMTSHRPEQPAVSVVCEYEQGTEEPERVRKFGISFCCVQRDKRAPRCVRDRPPAAILNGPPGAPSSRDKQPCVNKIAGGVVAQEVAYRAHLMPYRSILTLLWR